MARETVGDLLWRAEACLAAAAIPDAALEAEFLLAHFLRTDRGGILVRKREPVDGPLLPLIEDGIRRRAGREPFQYITGRQEFYGREFHVDPRVLIPRPETEQLIDLSLGLLPPGAAQVADLGTGSGCIAVTLAAERPDLHFDAVDRSRDALEAAAGNAERCHVEDRIRFHHLDLADLPASWDQRFDLVVSNPPYVSEAEWAGLAPEVRDHEPRQALVPDGEADRMYASLAVSASRVLKEQGVMVLELGHDSAGAAVQGAVSAGFGYTEVHPDFQGIQRMLVAGKGKRT
ncbi:MAG: peptide chain release factor N(5)-glutamine methyltransferase [Acidobacteria bacterium]|uniref:Release factor glutamine methyltransferase n=1 Tax=Candidatus Polarisedimenticola svalbardensis TaxID=2886004 RepID=A0A8J6XTX0_9BACT|nr:peptide chain release factor N(5)-glutamine methyltransferase [Candidatus Polarisedimenticola svalbardensis]